MAQMVSEVAQGQQYQFSSGDGGGSPTASQTRVFKVLLQQPGEIVNLQNICGVFIGDPHPLNLDLFCTSYGAQFDGDSRMVIVVTFTYESVPDSAGGGGGGGGGSGAQPPDIRPANWSISSAKQEVPVRTWRKRTGKNAWGPVIAARNAAKDLYDGVTKMAPIIKISITQFDLLDPTRHAAYAGSINSEEIRLGSLTIAPHTLMFDGLTVQSQVKPWGPRGVFRGWESTYEFSYWRNKTEVTLGDGSGLLVNEDEIDLGWDIAIPQSGWNVIAFDPDDDSILDEKYGQPLKHNSPSKLSIDTNNLELPVGITAGDKVPAMVKVFTYKDDSVSQARSASPVALNFNGRPRKVTAEPIVHAYQVHEAINITETLGLRLYGY